MLTHCKLYREFQEPGVFWQFITHQRHLLIYGNYNLAYYPFGRYSLQPAILVVKHCGVFLTITEEFESDTNCFEYSCFGRDVDYE